MSIYIKGILISFHICSGEGMELLPSVLSLVERANAEVGLSRDCAQEDVTVASLLYMGAYCYFGKGSPMC